MDNKRKKGVLKSTIVIGTLFWLLVPICALQAIGKAFAWVADKADDLVFWLTNIGWANRYIDFVFAKVDAFFVEKENG